MADPFRKKLVPITKLQTVRGVQLPIGLDFIQLVVTGPPGAGKTYYINTIHGWPNEGYLDLTRKGWWKDRSLTYRPREVHLGLPFEGVPQGLAVFDQQWLEASPPLKLQLNRFQLPPDGSRFLQTDWRQRYIFEFLLPTADIIFKQRQSRQSEGYFPVDEDLSLDMVKRQLAIYQEVVLYMHRVKMQVYVRESLDKPPMCIVEEGDAGIPRWATAQSPPRPSLKTRDGWRRLILRRDPINWLTITDEWQQVPKEGRVAYDGNPFELKIGKRILRFYPELPLGVRKKYLRRSWLVTDPRNFGSRICGFTRIRPADTVMIGRANQEYQSIFNFGKAVGKRHVNITNEKGDIIITPLDEVRNVEIIRITDAGREARVEARRYIAIKEIRSIYGDDIALLPSDRALALLTEVNSLLEEEPFRPRDDEGHAGGLIELPNQKIPILVGDLHAQVNNLLKILTENRFLDALEAETACLIILGDAVHSEIPGEMAKMENSILIMDIILTLKKRFPANVFYLRGNHDSFASNISKDTIPQGKVMQQQLLDLRGREYVEKMERFYELLPYVIKSESFVACHAGPSHKKVTRTKLINIYKHPKIRRDLIHSRLKRPNYLAGYSKGDVKRFRKGLNLAKGSPFIVGHTPIDPSGSVWRNVADIKGHHIIYSGRPSGPAVFVQLNGQMIPLRYPAEPLIKLIGKIPQKG
ncbi:MAG: serine/threonine protein phosphatase [Desulfobulbus sp.]|nr:MAG: serine/threonine protein phosphatase [Desulfobulbus sp.]